MKPEILIDTSAILALVISSDMHSARAKKWLSDRGSTHGIVVADTTVIEATSLLDRRAGSTRTNGFVNEVLPWIEQHATDELRMLQAISAYRASTGRRRPSLTDCVSFQLMRDLGIHKAFAFDQHFVDAGFTLVA